MTTTATYPASIEPYYERDGVSIICGDNCEVMRQMPSESIDLVVTSPPYDDLRTYGGHSWDFYGVAWNLKRLLKPGGVIVWVVSDKTEDGDETATSMKQALHFKQIGLRLHDSMVWNKPVFPLTHNRYEQVWEFMFVFSKGRPSTFNPIKERNVYAGDAISGTRRHDLSQLSEMHGSGKPIKQERIKGNVWQFATGFNKSTKDEIAFDHPAVFPEALARDHILSWSNEGDVVLDPFSGSGTTAKMAMHTGRQAIGIEINEKYCEIAVKRLEQRLLGFE